MLNINMHKYSRIISHIVLMFVLPIIGLITFFALTTLISNPIGQQERFRHGEFVGTFFFISVIPSVISSILFFLETVLLSKYYYHDTIKLYRNFIFYFFVGLIIPISIMLLIGVIPSVLGGLVDLPEIIASIVTTIIPLGVFIFSKYFYFKIKNNQADSK
jgi:hypothetical protein